MLKPGKDIGVLNKSMIIRQLLLRGKKIPGLQDRMVEGGSMLFNEFVLLLIINERLYRHGEITEEQKTKIAAEIKNINKFDIGV